MVFYDEKDMCYWRRQAKEGKAIILEIPVSMLLDLDIKTLSKEPDRPASIEDLERWMSENKEEIDVALIKEREEKARVEKLEQSLYDNQKPDGDHHRESDAHSSLAGNHDRAALTDEQAAKEVSMILAKVSFDNDQIAVIAEAMAQGLPEKYLLCFLKEEYSPQVMKKLKDYFTKIHQEEVKDANGKHSK